MGEKKPNFVKISGKHVESANLEQINKTHHKIIMHKMFLLIRFFKILKLKFCVHFQISHFKNKF